MLTKEQAELLVRRYTFDREGFPLADNELVTVPVGVLRKLLRPRIKTISEFEEITFEQNNNT